MEQTNTYVLYLLGKWLDSVFLSARTPMQQNAGAWENAVALLDYLIAPPPPLKGQPVRHHLDESAGAAITLRMRVNEGVEAYRQNPNTIMNDQWVASFNAAFWAFEQLLAVDLGRAPIFFVSQKAIYETPALINYAERALVDEVGDAISPEAKRDLNQSGRCLAFGLPTASAYHALRATEKALREWYQLATGLSHIPTGGKTKPLERCGMSDVINALRGSKKGDRPTLTVLDQIRELHRNAIDHPDKFIEPSEALELFNICTSAISAVARQMIAVRDAQGHTP